MNTRAMGIIFADIADRRLHELTAARPTASIPFGGRYRLIDFALSNFHHSGISNIGVVVQSHYRSLMDHLGSGKDWDLSRKHGGLSLLPPLAGQRIYHTRLEALCTVKNYIESGPGDVVVLSDSDVVYSMDLSGLIDRHRETGADVTVLYRRETVEPGAEQGLYAYETDETGRVTALLRDPPAGERLVGMHLLVFSKPLLTAIIEEASSYNYASLHRDILQKRVQQYRIFGREFDGYARHIDSLQSYMAASMDLLDNDVREDLFYRHGAVCTRVRDESPAQYGDSAKVNNSFVSDGCIIEGEVENCILFRGVTVGRGARVSNSIVMKNTAIGGNARLDYGIIDKNVRIADGRSLMGYGTYPLFISSGSTV